MPTSAPTDRIDLTSAAPEAFRALIALSAVDQGLDPALSELASLLWTVAATNTWNRIGIAGRAGAH